MKTFLLLCAATSLVGDSRGELREPLDPSDSIRGRVMTDLELPSGESMEIVVSTWTPPQIVHRPGSIVKRRAPRPTASDWSEVDRVPVQADGRFEVPRPDASVWIKLRVHGDLICWGESEFRLDGTADPGENEIEIEARLGAHVTLEFDLEAIASEDELSDLEGDVVTFSSFGDSTGRVGFGGAMMVEGPVSGIERAAVLRAVPPGSWAYVDSTSARDQALAPFVVQRPFGVEVAAGERLEITMPMERGQRFEGKVVDAAGTPVVGAELRMRFHHASPAKRVESSRSTRSDDEGRFVFEALPRQPGTMLVDGPDESTRSLDFAEVAKLMALSDPTVVLEKRASGESHTEVPFVPIGRPAGEGPKFAGAEESIEQRADPVNLLGEVRLPDGRPLGSEAVVLTLLSSGRLGRGPYTRIAFTDDAGHFAIRVRRERTYRVRLRSEAYVLNGLSRIAIALGEEPEPLTMTALPAAAIRIDVEAEDGSFPAHPRVSVRAIESTYATTRRLEESGERNGALGPLTPGRYLATYAHDLGSSSYMTYREVVDVKAGEIASVRFQVAAAPAARLTGRVETREGPVEGIRVELRDELGTVSSSRTSAEGVYELATRQTGHVQLVVGNEVANRDLDMVEGSNSVPPIELPTGRIDARFARFAPYPDSPPYAVPAPCVYRSSDEGQPFRFSRSISNGQFSFFFLPDGDYLVTLPGPDRRPDPRVEGANVTIRGGETVRGVELSRAED